MNTLHVQVHDTSGFSQKSSNILPAVWAIFKFSLRHENEAKCEWWCFRIGSLNREKWPIDLIYQPSACARTQYFKSLLFIRCIVAMTDTQSPTTESQTTIDDARARSRRSFIAVLKANRDVFSNLPERIEQWLEKETRATNQPETTKHGFVRPHWRMNRT